jgi:hypothetical protein
MSRPARLLVEGKTLQAQVQGWVKRLLPLLAAATAADRPDSLSGSPPDPAFTAFSPVKREKHSGRAASGHPYRAAQVVLRLLAERIVAGVFPALPPELVELVGGPALTAPEDEASAPIREEIARLPDALFDSRSLAGLNFEQPDRKRSGAYYTSPALARRITATALTPDQASQSVLDPACGGGIFLMAALERLGEFAPEISPEELVIERLYGLDLNPLAVWQTRLAILKRLVEIKPFGLNPALMVALAAQVRCGNALVGSAGGEIKGENRRALFEKIRAGDYPAALAEYTRLEAEAWEKRAGLAAEIAALPIFNAPGDGPALAALRPFGWAGEFPEVFERGGFGTVLGNPPYVGFNDYSGVEKAYFALVYPQVYNLKSDLLYYFIRRGVELLASGGRLGFVTSRFWKEAAFAAPLRGWLLAETSLLELEDLGGEQHFTDAEVDVCLLFAARRVAPPDHTFIFRFDGLGEMVAQQTLSGKTPWTWLRQLPAERRLLEEIAEKSCRLGEIAICRTGVQTGLDRVFFADAATVPALEPALLKRSIKNGDIGPGRLEWRGQWLIYPPPGFDPRDYPAALAYLGKYRGELERRQRYTKPFPFYELQWPREVAVFEQPAKLVTPYKAPRNTFAVDRQEFYFSTDVVSVVFPAGWQIEELAANILNSRLSTFQFRSYGKPVGGGQWDYYANPVKKLAFPKAALPAFPGSPPPQVLAALSRPGLSQSEVDELVFALYELTPPQIAMVNRAFLKDGRG